MDTLKTYNIAILCLEYVRKISIQTNVNVKIDF